MLQNKDSNESFMNEASKAQRTRGNKLKKKLHDKKVDQTGKSGTLSGYIWL